jgi:hypothetical protein
MAKKKRPSFSAPPTERTPKTAWVYRSDGTVPAAPPRPAPAAAAPTAARARRVPAKASAPPPTPTSLRPAPVGPPRATVSLGAALLLPAAFLDVILIQPVLARCRRRD